MKRTGEVYVFREVTLMTVFFLAAVTLSGCGKGKIVETQSNDRGGVIPLRVEERDTARRPLSSSAMTAAHNYWRFKVGVPQVRWSGKMEHVAKAWADSLKNDDCGFYHSGNGYGENLYKASPLFWSDGRKELQEKTPQEVADSWGREITNYNYNDNSCSGVCGHYTQVVWKETKEVGCAMSVCDDKSQIWVCSYYPAGNLVDKRPY
ncbi:MAG: SCP-like extracellular [Candidatus Electrothrix sp. AR4]|nr:SCP-like extracellular [Candidatus Electrothrix sp. AR4]